jgi:hypothetical protein
MTSSGYINGIFVVLLITLTFMVLFFLLYINATREATVLGWALENSGITCKPVKVDDKFYCSTTIYVNKNGKEDTMSVTDVDLNPK